jgi:hypothetical protein
LFSHLASRTLSFCPQITARGFAPPAFAKTKERRCVREESLFVANPLQLGADAPKHGLIDQRRAQRVGMEQPLLSVDIAKSSGRYNFGSEAWVVDELIVHAIDVVANRAQGDLANGTIRLLKGVKQVVMRGRVSHVRMLPGGNKKASTFSVEAISRRIGGLASFIATHPNRDLSNRDNRRDPLRR